MKKQITIMLGIILALPLVFAMYGGESEVIEFGFETDNCTIVPNETEGINFTFSNNQVLIEPAINFVGRFDITCYDWLTREEETESYGSGGYYTYPWRNKTEVNETKDINYTELLDEIEEVTFDDDEIIEEEDKDENHFQLTLIFSVFSIVLGLVIWRIYKHKHKQNKEEEHIEE